MHLRQLLRLIQAAAAAAIYTYKRHVSNQHHRQIRNAWHFTDRTKTGRQRLYAARTNQWQPKQQTLDVYTLECRRVIHRHNWITLNNAFVVSTLNLSTTTFLSVTVYLPIFLVTPSFSFRLLFSLFRSSAIRCSSCSSFPFSSFIFATGWLVSDLSVSPSLIFLHLFIQWTYTHTHTHAYNIYLYTYIIIEECRSLGRSSYVKRRLDGDNAWRNAIIIVNC